LISESSILDYRHFQMVRQADGFLIGTGLMRAQRKVGSTFDAYFKAEGAKIFKACGLRKQEDIAALLESLHAQPDYIGINFSPRSKRQIDPSILEAFFGNPTFWQKAVAVFYQNEEAEIKQLLARFPFRAVQLYAGDQSLDFLRSLKQRILLAVRMTEGWRDLLEGYAADVDCFILDGAIPGSGQQIGVSIPIDFPYPFLLAGGIHVENLHLTDGFANCIGVDIASGIETDGQVDLEKVQQISSS
jgi:phosphoribosylanthranilate isomerase